jgi:hypothetical protein
MTKITETRKPGELMVSALRHLVTALILGYFAHTASSEAFWSYQRAQPVPHSPGPLPAIIYLINRAALFAHDMLGTSALVLLLGIAALVFAILCVQRVVAATATAPRGNQAVRRRSTSTLPLDAGQSGRGK